MKMNLQSLSQNKIYLFILAEVPFELDDEPLEGMVFIQGQKFPVRYKQTLNGSSRSEVLAEFELENDSPAIARIRRGDLSALSVQSFATMAGLGVPLEIVEIRGDLGLEMAKIQTPVQYRHFSVQMSEVAGIPCRIDHFLSDKKVTRTFLFNSHDVDAKYPSAEFLCDIILKDGVFKSTCLVQRIGDFILCAEDREFFPKEWIQKVI